METAKEKPDLERNGLPRVAWTFSEWTTNEGAKQFRIVLVEGTAPDDEHQYRPGQVAVLEVRRGTDSMGVEIWHRASIDGEASATLAWSLAKEILNFDGPHCRECVDTGVVDEGSANGGGLKPPCTMCERGVQVAATRRPTQDDEVQF